MRIILLESVESLGGIGDIVDVRAGYGRNFLLPQGKAAPATDEQIAAFEERKSELLARERERMAATNARAEQVRSVAPLTIVANAGPVGKLYGSVGPAEISAGFSEAGIEVSRAEVQMPEGPIKELGEHLIVLKLHADVREEVAVNVVGQAGEIETLPGAEPLPSDEDEEAREAGPADLEEAPEHSAPADEEEAPGETEPAEEDEDAAEVELTGGEADSADPAATPEEAANSDEDG